MFIMTIFEMLCKVRLEYVMVFVFFCHLIVFGQQRGVVFFKSVLAACSHSELKSQ